MHSLQLSWWKGYHPGAQNLRTCYLVTRNPGSGVGERCCLQLRTQIHCWSGPWSAWRKSSPNTAELLGRWSTHTRQRPKTRIRSFSGGDPHALGGDLRQELGAWCTEILLQGDWGRKSELQWVHWKIRPSTPVNLRNFYMKSLLSVLMWTHQQHIAKWIQSHLSWK